jgi:GNAT superfamily N-acetyltransferase
MPSFAIRRATQADAGAAADVLLRSRADAVGSSPAAVHSDAEVREWVRRYLIVHLECWVAETPERKIIGLLALEADWIDQLYVTTDRQGSGVGSALLDQAKLMRPGRLQLWTFAANAGARRFYQRHGFVATEETDGQNNEEHAPDVRYEWVSTGRW